MKIFQRAHKYSQKYFILTASLLTTGAALLCGSPVAAQSGAIPLPDGIEQVVSIDAHNFLLVRMRDDDRPGQSKYRVIEPQHSYSGGLARVLGGEIVPTEVLVTPGFRGGFGGNFGGNQGGNFGGNQGNFNAPGNNNFNQFNQFGFGNNGNNGGGGAPMMGAFSTYRAPR